MGRWVLTLLCLTTVSVNAQTPPTASKQPNTGKTTAKQIEADVEQKRSIALSMLSSLAIEARSYRDEALRARVQARVADLLWEYDQEAARGLFTRAWEAANVNTLEADTRSVAGRTSVRATPSARVALTNLRVEILRLASARDHKLGEALLAKVIKTSEGDERTESTPAIPSNQETRERLRLASHFIEQGNLVRALQFADPVLVQTTTGTIQFLVALREKDQRSADERFVRLLAIAADDPGSDANTVSLLTSYAFTPSTYLQVSPTGIPSVISSDRTAPPALDRVLRANFFRVAANILLRPLEQLDRSSAGRPGTYLIARRLFPLFQQYAPELVGALSAHLAAMGPDAAQATQRAGERVLNRGFDSNSSETAGRSDVESDLKDLLDRATNGEERDRAYAFAAMQLARAADARAYDYVDKVEDTETRKSVRRIVDYGYLGGLLDKKKTDELIARVARTELNPALRANYLIRAAEVIVKTDPQRAREVLEKALDEANRIDAATSERAYVFVSLLSAFTRLDRSRAIDLAREVIKTANNVADFTGENGHHNWTIDGKFSARLGTQLAGPTDLPEAFAVLATDDFYQAIDISRNFKGDAPRALATLATARAVLVEKSK